MLSPSSKRQIQNKQFANEIFMLFERRYIKGRIKSEEIMKKWIIGEMIYGNQNYQLIWNQHVLKMPENRIPRKGLQYQPKEKRDLGKTSSCSCRKVIVLKTANGKRRGYNRTLNYID